MASQSRQGRGRLLPISILGPCFCSPGSMNLAAEQEGHLLAASPHPQQVPDRPEDVQGLPGLPVATPVGGGDRHKLSSGLFGACHLFHAGTTPPPSTCVPFFELQFPSIHPNQGFEILQGREPSPHPGGGGANMASLLLSTPAFLKSGHEVQMTSLSPWDRFLVEHT